MADESPSSWGAVAEESPASWGAVAEEFPEKRSAVVKDKAADTAARLGLPGAQNLQGDLIIGTPQAELDRPSFKLSDTAKLMTGRGAAQALLGPAGLLLPERVHREVGESLGGLIEGLSSQSGAASIPAAILAPEVVLPEMIKGGIETGVEQIAEGKPFAGATTLAIAASPAALPLARAALRGKGVKGAEPTVEPRSEPVKEAPTTLEPALPELKQEPFDTSKMTPAEKGLVDQGIDTMETSAPKATFYAATTGPLKITRRGIASVSESPEHAAQYQEGGEFGRKGASVKAYEGKLKIFGAEETNTANGRAIIGESNLKYVQPDGHISFEALEADEGMRQRLRAAGYDAARVSEGTAGTSIAVLPEGVQKLTPAIAEAAHGTDAIVPPEALPPPLPKESGTEPVATETAVPVTEKSLWRSFLEKHFELKPPKEVFRSSAPVDPPVLEALSTAIKDSKPARRETEALRQIERAKRARAQSDVQSGSPGRAGVGQLKSALSGELPRIDLEPFADKLTPAQQDALYNHIYGHELLQNDVYRSSNLAIALYDLMENGHLPQPSQVAWFERVFGPQVAQAMLGKQRVASRSLRLLTELANIPRSMITGFDLSATLRQGFSNGVAHPEVASQAFQAQIKAFADRNYAQALDRNFRSGPRAKVREKAGLEMPSIEGLADTSREEAFTSRIIQGLQDAKAKTALGSVVLTPIQAYAKGLAGSERAYVTYLNWLRTTVFDSVDAAFQDSGLPADILDLKRHQTAMLINSATGRGNVPSNALLNAFFFSPKFMASRFEYPFRVAKVAGLDRTALGAEARRQLAAHAAAWTGLFTLMHLASQAFDWPVEFGYDPRGADFLKVRLGDNVTIDTGAGYGQAIRLMARFLSGETADMITGKPKRTDRASEVGRFIRYKLAPVPSEVWSIAEGKTPDGREISVPEVVKDLTVPISIQNAQDIWQEFGSAGLPLLVPDLLGMGVNVYQQEPKRQR